MVDKLLTARRAMRVDLPWIDDGRYYELTTGQGQAMPDWAKSPTASACMSIRGYELSNVPWNIKRNGKILEKHPLIDMLTDFGPESNYQRGIFSTELDQFQYGAGYWFRDIDILKRLQPGTIKVIKTSAGISKFEQIIDGKLVNKFKREEIVYFREYHPVDDLGPGIPAVETCKRSITAEIEALLMVEANFKNDAVPGLLLTTEQDVTEKEANRVIDWWNKRFRGSRNKGKVGIAGKGLMPTVVGSNMKESGFVEVKDDSKVDICTTFRVDPILASGGTDATYLNFSGLRKALIESVIQPRATEYQNVINQDLVQETYPDVVFEFAWDEMQILQEDSTLKQSRLTEALGLGIIDEAYYRSEMGYPNAVAPEIDRQQVAEDKFEKKAVKALLRGDSPNVDFETDNISIDRQHVLHGRLMNATTKEAVRACFD